MLDFAPIRDKELLMSQLTADLTADDLRRLTNEMVDAMRNLIQGCTDAEVTFVPEDPEAFDSFAEDEADTNLAWTLGHVIVHTTASAEESARLLKLVGIADAERRLSDYPFQSSGGM